MPSVTHSQPWKPEQGDRGWSQPHPVGRSLHIAFRSQFSVCVLAPPLTVTSGKQFTLPQAMVSSSVQWVQSSKPRPPWVEWKIRKQYVCRAHSAGITVSTLGRHLPFLWVCSEPQNLLQPWRFSVHEPQMEHLNHSRELHWRGIEEWLENAPNPQFPSPAWQREAWQALMVGSRGEGGSHQRVSLHLCSVLQRTWGSKSSVVCGG